MSRAIYEDTKLSKGIRRKAEQILSSYRNLDALIKIMQMDLPSVKVTPSYELKEGSSGGSVSNTVESMYIRKEEIAERLQQKQQLKIKLDKIHNSLNERKKDIWELRYIRGWFDDLIIAELDISRRQYYREKNALLNLVAEAFYLI
ncbi:DUF1492 domain-containing protein [Gottfriedia acidiceleris]|uniref:DUF1492 domain-containing protein n=1 Tax=Gottfriedia acidiceleris TaxID=371036 RepID=UPI00101C0D43|nr:DUF1492 domain-containing protein [Gottfriedia acidiceleris]